MEIELIARLGTLNQMSSWRPWNQLWKRISR